MGVYITRVWGGGGTLLGVVGGTLLGFGGGEGGGVHYSGLVGDAHGLGGGGIFPFDLKKIRGLKT